MMIFPLQVELSLYKKHNYRELLQSDPVQSRIIMPVEIIMYEEHSICTRCNQFFYECPNNCMYGD